MTSSPKAAPTEQDLESILRVEPKAWTQAQVVDWLQLTHDGDLSDLREPFKLQKITGVTIDKLTAEQLKSASKSKSSGSATASSKRNKT